jgi:hypothetical protein
MRVRQRKEQSCSLGMTVLGSHSSPPELRPKGKWMWSWWPLDDLGKKILAGTEANRKDLTLERLSLSWMGQRSSLLGSEYNGTGAHVGQCAEAAHLSASQDGVLRCEKYLRCHLLVEKQCSESTGDKETIDKTRVLLL